MCVDLVTVSSVERPATAGCLNEVVQHLIPLLREWTLGGLEDVGQRSPLSLSCENSTELCFCLCLSPL